MERLHKSMELFVPDYRRSIVGLSNSIFHLFGMKPKGSRLDLQGALEGIEQLVLFVVDGLSAQLLEAHPAFTKLATKGSYFRISSVFPTTTTTAMASLLTGLAPAKHGLLGYSMLCRECGGLVELIRGMVRLPEHLTPRDILPYPVLFDEAMKRGVRSKAFLRRHLVESVLTKIFYGEAPVEAYVDLEDLLVKIGRERAELVGAYWEVIDTVGHVYGPSSKEMRSHVDRLVRALLNFPTRRGRRALVITSDHGLVDVRKREVPMMDRGLMGKLYLPPFGDLRATFLLPVEEGVKDYVERKYGRWSLVLDREGVVRKGLLGGRPSKETAARLGEIALLPDRGWWFDIRFRRSYEMKGAHSGLAKEELEVPLLILRY